MVVVFYIIILVSLIFITSIILFLVTSKESYSFSIIGSRVLPLWTKKKNHRIVNVPLVPFGSSFIQNKHTLNFTCGCIAGGISMIATYPLETTRTYLSLQTNKNKYTGIVDALKKIPLKQFKLV